MISALDSENLVDSVFCSHEARIRNVESFLDTARSVLESFDNSLLAMRGEYNHISAQLRDNLARNGSLRKKDFDSMMTALSADQDRRAQEVRDLSRTYLAEQTQFAHQLRQRLREFIDALAQGEAAGVTQHHQAITDLFARQQQHSEHVVSRLRESEEEQQRAAGMLRDLLARGRELRIKDLKSMLAEFKRQRDRRLLEQDQRREEVQDMLRESRARRVEAEQDRRRKTEGEEQRTEDKEGQAVPSSVLHVRSSDREVTWQERVDRQVEEMEEYLLSRRAGTGRRMS